MRCLYIEPFDAGSHAAFGRWLTQGIDAEWTALTLPGRHWKWRMRGAAVWFAREHAVELAEPYDVLLASSYLPLAELVGLVPTLSDVPKVLYFHENQLAFPVRREHVGGPDYHFGFTQLVSALAADVAAFNSLHNRATFLESARGLLRRMPDAVPRDWVDAIEAKSCVLPLPIAFPPRGEEHGEHGEHAARWRGDGPLIVWNHRWEHDKAPERFFDAMVALADAGRSFRVAVCGQRFGRAPRCFDEAAARLGARLVHMGSLPRDEYVGLLSTADICVSTADHEFFGVAVLEAMHCGARPLVPDRLAYQETVPDRFRYATDADLVPALTALLNRHDAGDSLRVDLGETVARYASERVLPQYRALFERLVSERRGECGVVESPRGS